MKILAIDTTTEACSAALLMENKVLEKYEVAPRRHAELILPMLDELLSEAGIGINSLDALAFARGPGAFTGVRLCASIAQGLAYAAELPVIPVSTLAALAQGADCDAEIIFSAIDARMHEVYWGLFSVGTDNLVSPISGERVDKPEALDLNIQSRCHGVGTGWGSYEKILAEKVGKTLQESDQTRLPRASDVLTLAVKELDAGNSVDAANALPVYLRNKVAG